MSISSSDLVLFIDADERISIKLKEYPSGVLNYVIPTINLWDSKIRINTRDDRVWYPSYRFRILRICPG
jgi:hypothetical protein